MTTSRLLSCASLLLALGAGCNETQHYGGGSERDAAMTRQHTSAANGRDSGADGLDAGSDAGKDEVDAAPPWPDAPPLRNPVDMADLELGKKALMLMGSPAVGADGSCNDCHSIGRATLSHWRELTATP